MLGTAGTVNSLGGARTLRIGLTGPIGCGKSTVAGWLAEAGAVVVDADRLAREVVDPGEPALEAVIARFGEEYRAADGSLDRAALGRLVFASPGDLADLEGIIHPAVRPRVLAAITEAEDSGAPALVVEAIKLVEGGLAKLCDEVWLVTCTPEEQRARVIARGLAPDEADRRIAAQAGLVARVSAVATRVIDTSGALREARALVEAAFAAAVFGAR